ncbi:MAG: FG-GAP repeat domain-containing protein [Candidatus Thorarchaeota archaeon]
MVGSTQYELAGMDQGVGLDLKNSEPILESELAQEPGAPYLSNYTLPQDLAREIMCVAVGDADNDGDQDIVAGTSFPGLVVLLENIGVSTAVQYNSTVIANFTKSYGLLTSVPAVAISDLEGTGENSIVVGTAYYSIDWEGGVLRFEKTDSGWQQTESISTGIDSVPGGVYSLDVGKVGDDNKLMVVVGQGFGSALVNRNLTAYTHEAGGWQLTNLLMTNQTRISVCIGDYASESIGNEIIFCTYTDVTNNANSTLGYMSRESGVYHYTQIANFTYLPSDSPPYTKFMCVRMGDLEGDGDAELVVALDNYTMNSDSIRIYNAMGSVSIAAANEWLGDEIAVGDFDNDERDEVLYGFTNTTLYPTAWLKYYDWNGSAGDTYLVGRTTEPFVSAITVGDVDTDGEQELLYGTISTSENGKIVVWDYAPMAFSGLFEVDPMVSLIQGSFNLTCDVQVHGWNNKEIKIKVATPGGFQIIGQPTEVNIGDRMTPGAFSMEWEITPLAYGIYDLDIETSSLDAGVNTTSRMVIVTDLEVANVVASNLTAAVGDSITISGEVRYIHNTGPVGQAQVYLDGVPVASTNALGEFSFQQTESVAGLRSYNLTASLDVPVVFSDSAVFQILQVEWTAYSEGGLPLELLLVGVVGAATIIGITAFYLLRKRRGGT